MSIKNNCLYRKDDNSVQNNNSSILYIVPTPIGNLSDMTYRGVQVLSSVDIIYAEDTRKSGILLKNYGIKTPMKSYHKFNEKHRCVEIIKHLKINKTVAIISDAGTPGISDPSNIIVQEAIKNNIQVVPLPGATALIPALVGSGFDTKNFYMAGFVPTQKKEREELYKKIKNLEIPIVFYESANRLKKFFEELNDNFDDFAICIAREISKIHETFYRGKIADILENFEYITLKGEFVIIIVPKIINNNIEELILHKYNEKYFNHSIKTASLLISSELNLQKNKVYGLLLEHNKKNT